MAKGIIRDQKLWSGSYDITGETNSLSLELGVETVDDTCLGDTTRSALAGLKTGSVGFSGAFDPTKDDQLFNVIGVDDTPFSVGTSGTEGDVSYSFKSVHTSFNHGGSVGDLHSFDGSAGTRNAVVRGQILANKTTITSTGLGTKFQLGAVASGEKLYASLHVIGASTGGAHTLDVVLESDADSSAGGETTRITFTQVGNAVSSEWMEVSGAITDTWWRTSHTPSTGASYDYVVVAGIL